MPNQDDPRLKRLNNCAVSLLAAILAALLISAFAQAQESGTYGAIALGQAVEMTLTPAPPDGVAWHAYSVQLPSGVPALYVLIDGLGNDIDLAVKFGAEIVSYDDVDYLDASAEGNPWFGVENPE